jgi:hypothetical protein
VSDDPRQTKVDSLHIVTQEDPSSSLQALDGPLPPAEMDQSVDFNNIFSDRYDIAVPVPLGQTVDGFALSSANSPAPLDASVDNSWAIENIISREKVMYLVTMFFEFVSDLPAGSN